MADAMRIYLQIGSRKFPVQLYDCCAARSLFSILPQTISMQSWGCEFYGEIPVMIDYTDDTMQDVFQPGELALWPQGNAVCIFWGPTPISESGECRMASDGVAIGKISGDITQFNQLRNQLGYVRLFSADMPSSLR